MNLLKKTAIVVACTTVGVLAVAPIASAQVAGPATAGQASMSATQLAPTKKHKDDDSDYGSGNVWSYSFQDGSCNNNSGNDDGLFSFLNFSKNTYHQKHSCNPKNKTKSHS